jgi:hypothetical protein
LQLQTIVLDVAAQIRPAAGAVQFGTAREQRKERNGWIMIEEITKASNRIAWEC